MTDEFLKIKKKLDFVLWGLNDEDTETVLGILEMKYQENERLRKAIKRALNWNELNRITAVHKELEEALKDN